LVIETGHKSLLPIFQREYDAITVREKIINRFNFVMSSIFGVLKYIPGESNVFADLVSCVPSDEVIPNVYTVCESGMNELITDIEIKVQNIHQEWFQ
jgi:hypothetical protein